MAVLRKLLRHIEQENADGHDPYLVSHAWAEGPRIFLVYTAPPSSTVWGLVRDTRESIIDPAPWPDVDEAVRYYYLLDFEENQPSASRPGEAEDDSIWWFGHPRDGAPVRPSDIPAAHRYTPPAPPPPSEQSKNTRPDNEPRRYGNRL
ncbi:hypothetical protein [Mycolicibacterium chubuense]|nr:hypothetical protein [Mycolicibacterium chubuense]